MVNVDCMEVDVRLAVEEEVASGRIAGGRLVAIVRPRNVREAAVASRNGLPWSSVPIYGGAGIERAHSRRATVETLLRHFE